MSLHLREIYVEGESVLHRMDARTKLICALALPFAVLAMPLDASWSYAACFALALVAFTLSRCHWRELLRFAWIPLVPLFIAALFLPFFAQNDASGSVNLFGSGVRVARQGIDATLLLLARSTLTVLVLGTLALTTKAHEIFAGLARLGLPKRAAQSLALSFRLTFVFAEETLRMVRARDARGYRPRFVWSVSAIGRVAGALFLRAYARGERLQRAMLARSGSGHADMHFETRSLSRRDWLAMAVWLGALVALAWSAQ